MTAAYVSAELYLLCDSPANYFSPEMRHINKHNILWLDGHVKHTDQNLRWTTPYSWGYRPVGNYKDNCPANYNPVKIDN